jgi:hypothetical protein
MFASLNIIRRFEVDSHWWLIWLSGDNITGYYIQK